MVKCETMEIRRVANWVNKFTSEEMETLVGSRKNVCFFFLIEKSQILKIRMEIIQEA